MEQLGHLISNPEDAFKYMFGGKATFSLKNVNSGNHRTYRVNTPKHKKDEKPSIYFVKVNNGKSYVYIGVIDPMNKKFRLTAKSRQTEDSPSVKGFKMLLNGLIKHNFPNNSEFWHHGNCSVCGRTLTNPVSITSGIGPICSKNQRF